MIRRALVVSESGLTALRRHPLTKAESTVLWHAAAQLPPAGDVVSMASWARQLKMSHVHVVNCVKKLVVRGFLTRGRKDGTRYHLRLNAAHFTPL
jgi:DNA-binding MarR family transcriptional regulator